MTSIRILFILSILIASPALAIEAFDGIHMQDIVVDGKIYQVPLGNEERRSDVYYLKKALKGDSEALSIFLGGASERLFYIGQYEPLWLKVDSNGDFKVIDPRSKDE